MVAQLNDGPVSFLELPNGNWRQARPAPERAAPPGTITDAPAFQEVAPDGSTWRADALVCVPWPGCPIDDDAIRTEHPDLEAFGRCGGVARHDGGTWTSYLDGHCVIDLEFDADGDTWVQAIRRELGEVVATVDGVDLYEFVPVPGTVETFIIPGLSQTPRPRRPAR